MSSQVTPHTRAENSADLLRILVALGVLAILASFDGNGEPVSSATASTSTPATVSAAQ